jgi:hypothetical protein
MVTAFKDAGTNMKTAGENLVTEFVNGVESKNSKVTETGKTSVNKYVGGAEAQKSQATIVFTGIAEACVNAISATYSNFHSAGKNVVQGFANGISDNTYLATAKARAMAKAAATAAESELDINSPSKVFRAIGYSVPEGFALGIDKMSRLVTNSSRNMSNVAVDNVRSSISRIASIISSDIDTQPTIRPVLDLSDVRSGANSLSNMFGADATVGVRANVGAISAMMNGRSQNGVNDEVVSAINKLRKDLANVGNTTYSINGVTYDDGSNVTDAVRTIVRAAKIERRV